MPTKIEDVFLKIGRQEKLDQIEQNVLFDYVRRTEDVERLIGRWEKTGVNTQKIIAQETNFLLSPARPIVFTGTTKTSVPNNTYYTIDFTGTRGLLNDDPKYHGCVTYVNGYLDRFTKQSWVRPGYPIFFFGDFGFDTNTNGSREIYIEFFDKDNVSLGGYTFSADAAPSDWTNFSFCFMDWFEEGDYCKFEVWQDSGSALGIMSANFGFMLG